MSATIQKIKGGSINPSTKDLIFSDFDFSFKQNPIDRDLLRVTNSGAIRQSLKNIILTGVGERPFAPEFGSSIRRLLFENLSPIVAVELQTIIKYAIKNYEPRALVSGIVIAANYEKNGYEVTIVFSVINQTTTEKIKILLERIR